MNLLVYNARLRLMRKREEHHRAANDADDPPKHEQLWGQGANICFLACSQQIPSCIANIFLSFFSSLVAQHTAFLPNGP